ncbi:sugar ABC transporter substrate-binding protein [Mesotoga sp.]|uniref:ABC transporter substrate-binding protein n=1 Tax=Mesotoga sp. TaxID=2053577 RepID=UPI001BD47071|nr:sugar ABC transporter substrate-binding protein [Mesotoga sp.]
MRKSTLLVLLMLVVLAFTGVSQVINIWIGGQVAELDETWDMIVGKFEKETGMKVEVQLFGFDIYYDKLLTALQGGQGPDLAFADLGGWVPTFAERGWLEPMGSLLDSWDGTEQIWPNLWPTVQHNGERYGLPWYTDCRLLLYNQTMFDQAGLDRDNPPETWEELVFQAMKLTDASKRVFGYGVSGTKTEHTTLAYIIFLYGAGGQLLTDDYSAAAFNTPEGLRALKFYTDLALTYGVSPNAVTYNEDDYRNMMAQNRVAMAVGGPWSFPLIETANPGIVGNYTVSLHPYGATPASVLGGWALVIPSASKNKDNAWELAKYLTSYETWMTWIEAKGGPMPSRQDVCFDAPVLQDPKWKVIFETFPHAVSRPPIPEYPQVSEQIQIMIQDVLLGKATPEEAMKTAEAKVNAILGK